MLIILLLKLYVLELFLKIIFNVKILKKKKFKSLYTNFIVFQYIVM